MGGVGAEHLASDNFVPAIRRAILDRNGDAAADHSVRGGEGVDQAASTLADTEPGWSVT